MSIRKVVAGLLIAAGIAIMAVPFFWRTTGEKQTEQLISEFEQTLEDDYDEETDVEEEQTSISEEDEVDCQHFFRQIFLGYFSDIVQAFDTLRTNVCGDDYTSLHNPIVLSSVLPAYGMFHSIQILFL